MAPMAPPRFPARRRKTAGGARPEMRDGSTCADARNALNTSENALPGHARIENPHGSKFRTTRSGAF
jgi:hypothetical protein